MADRDQVATPQLRLGAALIDWSIALPAVALVVGGGLYVYTRMRGDHKQQPGADTGAAYAWSGVRSSSWQQAVLHGASSGLGVAGRNWRTPGYRLTGLRRVDARTGGPVAVRSTITGALFDSTRAALTWPLFRSRVTREQERLAGLQPQLGDIHRKHIDDPQALQQALMEFYKANDVGPLPGCAWTMLPSLVVQLLVNGWLYRGQTIRDRVTGTVVIVDRGWQRRPRLRCRGPRVARFAPKRAHPRLLQPPRTRRCPRP